MTGRWHEQYDRIQRWYTRLTEATAADDRHVDDYYAFFVTCFHFKDWLKEDKSVDRAVAKDAEVWVSSITSLSLSADLANGIKHVHASRTPRLDPDTRLELMEEVLDPGASIQKHFDQNLLCSSSLITRRCFGETPARSRTIA